jgi:2-methylaconitate cis-trans-isomerase PrpF
MVGSRRIRATIIRGGTSKGVFLFADDLPADAVVRDRVILSIFGSPDARQLDGLGGADPLTSKVAIIARSARADADVDYTVGYVGIGDARIDYQGNCGNISTGVGPFAIDEGLVVAAEPMTRVRIFNTNTKKLIEAEVPVRDGHAVSDGDFVLPGVPGTGAPIMLNFVDSAGSKTGRLLPTGHTVDTITLHDGSIVRVSLVDAAAPAIFVKASDVGLTGTELPLQAAAKPRVLDVMEEIRIQGALLMGLATNVASVSPAIPKVAIVAPPQDYATIDGTPIDASACDIVARTKALAVMHKAYAITGGICLSAAALIDGTVVNEVVAPTAVASGSVRVGHPTGVATFHAVVERTRDGFALRRSGVAGTARRIMDGFVYIPERVFAGA